MKTLSSSVSGCSSELAAVEVERASFEACPLCGGKLHP
jgi:hypothetical protein